jgi:regulator of nucleoside diphosphate kinase
MGSMSNEIRLLMTEKDARKLRTMIQESASTDTQAGVQWQLLEEEIEKASIVPAVNLPADVVTMHSRVRIVDMRTGEQLVYQIVYPHEANYAEKRISILAPIGMALLGYAAGTEIEWKVPSGSRRLRIEAVEQPTEIQHERAVA